MSKQDFNFIELPTLYNMLSEQEQDALLGGFNCKVYTVGGHCEDYLPNSPCKDKGACGGDFYCGSFNP